MKSLKKLYNIGPGPSSSHTIGPRLASTHFLSLIKDVPFKRVLATLYGSLALTGKGHGTPDVIKKVFKDYEIEVKFDYLSPCKYHPNTMTLEILDENNKSLLLRTYFSIGGGAITCLEDRCLDDVDIYNFKNFDEIKDYMNQNHYTHLYQVVLDFEKDDILDYMSQCFDMMIKSVESGLKKSGQIQAGINLWVDRNAKKIYSESRKLKNPVEKILTSLAAYAYAVGEENASGNDVVTAPTCGSCGIIPSVVYYLYKQQHFSKKVLVLALLSAGIIGDVFKQNATISGAVGGCQAEVGVAVCMATALLCDVYNLNMYQLEYGCELAMEHHLGLTCDSIDGYVVIPCVERNAVGAARSYESFLFAKIIANTRKNSVSLDEIVETMKITGCALSKEYRETGEGGISKVKSNAK